MRSALALRMAACGIAVALALAGGSSAYAQAAQRSASAKIRWRVEPGTPLADALRAFARESGYDVVFGEQLVRGKTSNGVRSAASPYDALTQILAGTGLVPRFTRRDAFILEPVVTATTPDLTLKPIELVATPPDVRKAEYRWYGEKLLNASLAALRKSSELGQRSYSFTVYVWLSSEGQVVGLDGHGSSADTTAFSKAKDVLTGLFVGVAPPEDMPQPVGLRISAQ